MSRRKRAPYWIIALGLVPRDNSWQQARFERAAWVGGERKQSTSEGLVITVCRAIRRQNVLHQMLVCWTVCSAWIKLDVTGVTDATEKLL